MSKDANILERSVLQEGKVFIKAGEENIRAYVIQNGEVASYIHDQDKKIEVERYGPGTLIGEMALMIDQEPRLSFETLTTTTMITITRQDFQKKLARTDKSIQTILDHAVKKLNRYERETIAHAMEHNKLDDMAAQLMKSLTGNLSEDKKVRYEHALLPHLNGLIKEIKNLKQK